jgi:hypothetical protein
MRVAFGLKAHSGWSALVVLARTRDGYRVIDRRRIQLLELETASWAAQPYHAAEGLTADEARAIVKRGIESAHRAAVREIRAAVERSRSFQHEITGCAVLVPEPMPDWSTEQILAVHFRMHKAEGVLFPDALARAGDACGLNLIRVPEKRLWAEAEKSLALKNDTLLETVASLGKAAGPPWGKDQKSAALAAMMAFARSRRRD